ncbi:MAG: cupin domain-containing protein [Candidatus Pacebacteria bacterium]|nr:cupin domain-containing protein [Candidatus Paceibacterota bacterium]
MKNNESLKKELVEKGFLKISECFEEPNSTRDIHTHEGDLFLTVTQGSMDIFMNEKVFRLSVGDEIFIPKEVPHSAKIGADGCSYIDGEN